MSKIESNLEKFKSVLDPLTKNMTFGRKEFLNKLFAEIINEVNMNECAFNKFKAKTLGFDNSDEYVDSLNKSISILQILGFTRVDFIMMKKEVLDWIIDNKKEMSKHMTVKNFQATYDWCDHFLLFNCRLPESVEELKEYSKAVTND